MTAVICVGVFFGGTLLEAFVLTKLWKWFISPEFGFNELSMTAACGIVLALSMVGTKVRTREEVRILFEDELEDTLMTQIATPLLILFFGWIIRIFVM